jgi:hypothetical protein
LIIDSNSGQQEHQQPTADWRYGGFSASYDSLVQGSSSVFQMNICAKIPPLRKAVNRSQQKKRK